MGKFIENKVDIIFQFCLLKILHSKLTTKSKYSQFLALKYRNYHEKTNL